MSCSGALRKLTNGGESGSHLVVEACLARIRIDARLDEEPVLAPLEVVVVTKTPLPFPGVHTAPVSQVMPRSAPESVQLGVESPAPTADTFAAECIPRAKRRRGCTARIVQRVRWPVLLCGFLAGTFGGVALMKSPVGHRPAVQHAVKVTAARAYSWTTAVKARIAH